MQKEFQAVISDDIDSLLETLELKGLLDKKELKCSHCKTVLKRESIFAIYPISGDIKIICTSVDCVDKALEQTK